VDHLGPPAGADDRPGISDRRNNPLVRNPKLAALLGVPAPVVVMVFVPGLLGLVIGVVLLVVDPLVLYWVFKKQHDEAFGPASGHHRGPIVG